MNNMLDFYNPKTRKKFNSSKFTLKKSVKGNRETFFALTVAPTGNKVSRIISKSVYLEGIRTSKKSKK